MDEFRSDKKFQTILGRVRPHPRFRLVLDSQGHVVENRADLAVILLEESMLGRFPEVTLARTEARAGEQLIMVGYGHAEAVGTVFGVRYCGDGGMDPVMETLPAYFEFSVSNGQQDRENGYRSTLLEVIEPRQVGTRGSFPGAAPGPTAPRSAARTAYLPCRTRLM